ncbi:hypothetical protein IMZ48_14965 [Candidatus Bathyarchaeota archaeon]|nr:hypothetical protein [Candidatus Bathyarchaeota archaeon]
MEKVEKQMVSLAEGKELANSGAVAASANDQDWDAGWDDEGGHESPSEEKPAAAGPVAANEDDGADAWGWDDEPEDIPEEQPAKPEPTTGEDDGADAWGWGDEDTTEAPAPKPKPAKPVTAPKRKATVDTQTKEMILRETYHVSSMPEPVLNLIFAIMEDGAALTVEG